MNDALLDSIEILAGSLRARTFRAAAEFVLNHDCKRMVETGCYRGAPTEGKSTIILGMLAETLGGTLDSFDISDIAIGYAAAAVPPAFLDKGIVEFHCQDSVIGLGRQTWGIKFAYLDSLDCGFPGAQMHELAEIGAILGKMKPPCAILLDDVGPDGKTVLGAEFLSQRGWKIAASGYQLLFTLLE